MEPGSHADFASVRRFSPFLHAGRSDCWTEQGRSYLRGRAGGRQAPGAGASTCFVAVGGQDLERERDGMQREEVGAVSVCRGGEAELRAQIGQRDAEFQDVRETVGGLERGSKRARKGPKDKHRRRRRQKRWFEEHRR